MWWQNMEPYDWSEFEITFYYRASKRDVAARWTTCNGLRPFFVEHAEFHVGSERRGPGTWCEIGA
ncbi:MAG: hypothetical protein AAF483_31420 [Planctomycetota bacterium]